MENLKPEVLISVAAILVSVITFIVSHIRNIKLSVESKKPIIIFTYLESGTWNVTNVGNGPALNILIHHGDEASWFKPTRIPALGKDASFELSWLRDKDILRLASTYSDFNGKEYTTECKDDHSKIFQGSTIEFEQSDIVQHWNVGLV